jgi:hypothetical protein
MVQQSKNFVLLNRRSYRIVTPPLLKATTTDFVRAGVPLIAGKDISAWMVAS